jgi:hypothetical protein
MYPCQQQQRQQEGNRQEVDEAYHMADAFLTRHMSGLM